VHVHNIIKKLGVRNRTEAAVTARNMRTVPPTARC
jgi:DNA-binding NarL/FixJ family response regulator